MTIYRHYKMTAAEGRADALGSALSALADEVRKVPGSTGVKLLQVESRPEEFLFIEEWESIEAHKSAGAHVSKSVLEPVTAALGSTPDGLYARLIRSW